MRIFNARLGHANNSSSSHSIIMVPPDKLPKNSTGGIRQGHFEFGRQNFTLSSRRWKQEYLAATLYENLQHLMHEDLAAAVVRSWVDEIPLPEREDGYLPVYVDHQSRISLPIEAPDDTFMTINREFFDELSAYLLRPDIVILGGGDEGDPHPLTGAGPEIGKKLVMEDFPEHLVARKDPELGYWTIFNRQSGTRIRLSFADEKMAPTKATYPEMVDLKITDRCNRGCEFCYQGSDSNGVHADKEYITQVLYVLGQAQVFEVAIGGGEPTEHPYFDFFLSSAKSRGINANFTTARLDWLRDPHRRRVILDSCRSFAYSVRYPDDVDELVAAVREHIEPRGSLQYGIQCVLGVVDPYQAKDIIKRARMHSLPVTLLGAKMTGRGDKYHWREWENEDGFRHTMDMDQGDKPSLLAGSDYDLAYNRSLSIDTSAAMAWQRWLVKYNVPKVFYETTEGDFNCYIDGVNQTIAASSYKGEPVPFKAESGRYGRFAQLTIDQLREAFAGIQVV